MVRFHTRNPCFSRKLEDKGIGELSFDEVYRALLLGAVPPTLITDAVRLLAAGNPGEGGGAGFLSGEASTAAYYGGEEGSDVSLMTEGGREGKGDGDFVVCGWRDDASGSRGNGWVGGEFLFRSIAFWSCCAWLLLAARRCCVRHTASSCFSYSFNVE